MASLSEHQNSIARWRPAAQAESAVSGPAVATAFFAAFAAFGLFAAGLVIRRGRSALKERVPFGPFLAVGAIFSLLAVLP
jgi:prepilin signal peptidase PulO-like enzyme (type II secretory pathway)